MGRALDHSMSLSIRNRFRIPRLPKILRSFCRRDDPLSRLRTEAPKGAPNCRVVVLSCSCCDVRQYVVWGPLKPVHCVVDMHFTPTHSPSFNQGKPRSGDIDLDMIACGVLAPVSVQKSKVWKC